MERGIILKGLIVECGLVTGFVVEAHNKGNVQTQRVSKSMLLNTMSKGIPAAGVTIFNNELCVDAELYRSLPIVKTELEIKETIKSENNNTIGYELTSADGKSVRLSVIEAWKLAVSNGIKDTQACVGKVDGLKYIVRKAVE